METRNARMYEVEELTEITDAEPVDVSAPTVVISAAPLKTVMESSGPTRRDVPTARPPGRPLGAPRIERRAQTWSTPTTFETAPVGPIPMPGERPSADVVTIVQCLRGRLPELPTRAAEKRAEYIVGGSQPAPPTQVVPKRKRESRGGLLLVGIIGLLAGLVMVLSVVVVRQQAELRETRGPALRAANACDAYASEVNEIANELTRHAGDVTAVAHRIGERARGVVAAQPMQQLCVPDAKRAACSHGEPACVADAVMQLRQALARR